MNLSKSEYIWTKIPFDYIFSVYIIAINDIRDHVGQTVNPKSRNIDYKVCRKGTNDVMTERLRNARKGSISFTVMETMICKTEEDIKALNVLEGYYINKYDLQMNGTNIVGGGHSIKQRMKFINATYNYNVLIEDVEDPSQKFVYDPRQAMKELGLTCVGDLEKGFYFTKSRKFKTRRVQLHEKGTPYPAHIHLRTAESLRNAKPVYIYDVTGNLLHTAINTVDASLFMHVSRATVLGKFKKDRSYGIVNGGYFISHLTLSTETIQNLLKESEDLVTSRKIKKLDGKGIVTVMYDDMADAARQENMTLKDFRKTLKEETKDSNGIHFEKF